MQLTGSARALCAATVAALAIAGCGGDREKDLEKKLSEQIEKELGQKPEKVDCPKDVEDAKKGSKYTCTITGPEGSADVQVEFVNDDLDFKVTAPGG
jgi:hypothetical protein